MIPTCIQGAGGSLELGFIRATALTLNLRWLMQDFHSLLVVWIH